MRVIGKGSITRAEKKERSKCRKWKLRVQTDEGELTRRFNGTYTQAQTALAKWIGELITPVTKTTFEDYAETWMRRREQSNEIADSTLRKNKQQLRILVAEFGKLRLHEINKPRAEDGLLHIRNGSNPSNITLSGTYANQIHVLMKSVMESAVDDALIATNPLNKIKAPKIDTKKRRSLSREELARFICALDSLPLDSHTIGIRIAVLAGLRRGEVVGLQWGDIEGGVIRVRRSMAEHDRALKDPKTDSGIRDVPMVEQLEAALATWKPIQRERLAALGIEQHNDTPVVTSEVGRYTHPQNIDRWWRQVRDSFGLEGVVIHELRHTYLTMLASGGAPSQVLKSLAGWASIAMADTYVHDDSVANSDAVKNFGEMLDTEIERAVDVTIDVTPDVTEETI